MKVRPRLAVTTAAGMALAMAMGGAVGFRPVVCRGIASRARARGLEVTARRAWPGLGRIWLGEVVVRIPEAPGVRLVLREVEAQFSPTLRLRRVEGHGGWLEIHGPLEGVREDLARWQRSGSAGRSRDTSSYVPVSADGIEVVWSDASPGSATQHAWGLSLERTGVREADVRADLVRLEHRGWQLEVVEPSLTLSAQDGHVLIQRLAALEATGRVDLERRHDGDGASVSPDSRSSAPVLPFPSVSGSATRSPGSLAAPSPAGARWGLRTHRALTELAKAGANAIPLGGLVDLAALRLEAHHRDQTLSVGPGRLQLGRDTTHLRLNFRPGGPDQPSPLNLTLEVPLDHGPVVADLAGGPVTLAALGIDEGSFGLQGVRDADATVQGRLALSEDGLRLTFDGHAALHRLAILQPSIAPRPLSGIDLGWEGRGEVLLDGSSYRVDAGEVRLGAARLELSGQLNRQGEHVQGELTARLPLAACQDLLSSAPQGLAPLLDGVTLTGTFSLAASARFDTRRVNDTRVDWRMSNDCRVATIPPDLDPSRFARPWEREVFGADRRRMTIESGPGTPTWAPLEQISPHMVTALLICEDSRFFRHQGFDQEAIANALRDNINHQRFFRGASTLSMQLAKNLFLGREKTLARKLEEAVLTLLLEQSLTKEQLLELYLNVVEFGPGIYGIGPAAAHYFASTPGRLSLGQALYLASILPNPRVQHFGADGQVTDRWLAYLHKLMHIARKIDRVDDAELAAALAEPIVFQRPSTLPALGAEATEMDSEDPPAVEPDLDRSPSEDRGGQSLPDDHDSPASPVRR